MNSKLWQKDTTFLSVALDALHVITTYLEGVLPSVDPNVEYVRYVKYDRFVYCEMILHQRQRASFVLLMVLILALAMQERKRTSICFVYKR